MKFKFLSLFFSDDFKGDSHWSFPPVNPHQPNGTPAVLRQPKLDRLR